MNLQPITISGYDKGGLQTNKKPFMLINEAFPRLENAYCWRDRVKKREGLELIGRLRRILTSQSGGLTTGADPFTFNIFTVLSRAGSVANITNAANAQVTTVANHNLITGQYVTFTNVGGMTEVNNKFFQITVTGALTFTLGVSSLTFGVYTPATGNWRVNNFITENGDIEPFSVTITFDFGGANETIYSDNLISGRLDLVSGPFIGTGIINYATGDVTIDFGAAPGAGLLIAITISYFPGLPVMGIDNREVVVINDEQEIFFDTKYAYIYSGTGFQEFIPGFVWSGTDSNFFWMTNYRGATPESRLFFETNFSEPALSPNNRMRYVDQVGAAWVDFTPIVADLPESAAQSTLWMARILIPYYGRLVALNVWEGGTTANAVNIPNRCRFSQIGSPIEADAWRSDKFGKGGFIDAPTVEQIISARFFKNTLIVGFEHSTWQLRYVGEYGLPFIWERISSDFGAESQFSTILFDDYVLQVGDKAITAATAVNVDRIDLQIPDLVFNSIQNKEEGQQRTHGIRDFQKELVFWCYSEASFQGKFPNKTLVYNYRNNTYAIFRNSVTCFGILQVDTSITWDSQEVFWDDQDITWADDEVQSEFPYICSGNQQGFIHRYGYTTSQDEPSLIIESIDVTVTPILVTSTNHNLQTGEIIYLTDMVFYDSDTPPNPLSSTLNNSIYYAQVLTADTFNILKWDGTAYIQDFTFSFTPTPVGVVQYLGNGKITLFPKMIIQTKDFNPYQAQGGQAKLSYIDFLTDSTPSGVTTIQLFANTAPAVQGNLLVGNTQSEQYLTTPYYTPTSDIAWHRFYATLAAQYFRVIITYDDSLMSTLSTHQQTYVLNAMTLWTRPGGKIIF